MPDFFFFVILINRFLIPISLIEFFFCQNNNNKKCCRTLFEWQCILCSLLTWAEGGVFLFVTVRLDCPESIVGMGRKASELLFMMRSKSSCRSYSHLIYFPIIQHCTLKLVFQLIYFTLDQLKEKQEQQSLCNVVLEFGR